MKKKEIIKKSNDFTKVINKNNKIHIQNNYNYVIIIRKEILELTYLEKEKELITLFKRIGEKNEK